LEVSLRRDFFLCAVLLSSIAAAQAPWQAGSAKDKPMRIEMNRFSFEIPYGFEDTTNYTFKDQKDRELLTVSFSPRPEEATDLRTLMKLRRGNLDLVVPGAAKIEGESNTRVDSMPGRMLVFTFAENGVTFRERWAVAFPTADMYLQISYTAPARDARSGQRFNHILLSVVPAQRTPVTATPEGYARYWAKRMTLDVPASLSPPRVYQFVAGEDSQIRLNVKYYDAQSGPAPVPNADQEMAQDAAVGAIGNQQSGPLTTAHGSGLVTMYSVKPPRDAEIGVRTGELMLNNGVKVQASIRGPFTAAPRLDQILAGFIQSVTPK
jgi:hypothetical protein